MAIIGSIPHFQTYPYVHQLNWLSNLESSPHSNRIRLAMMNPSQETHPRQPCTSPAGRWMTQAVTLISTVRKIIHDPDVPKTEQLFCEYWFICMIKNNITEQCASYAMNWWTLLRGIPCSPSEGLDKVWRQCGHKPSNRTGQNGPWGPTWSYLKYGLMMFDDHHCYSLTWIMRQNLCIAWEIPGKSGNYLAVPVQKKFQFSGTPHFLGSHLDPAAMMEFGDWHFFCLFLGMKSSRITQIDPEKPTVFCGSSSKKCPKSPKTTRCLWLWINHKQSVLYGW